MPAIILSAWSRPRRPSRSPNCSPGSRASKAEAGHGRQQLRNTLQVHQLGRETAVRVAAAAIAGKILGDGVKVRGAVVQLGTQKIDRSKWDWDATGDNPFWCPDRQAGQAWEGYLDDIRKRGSSCGAIIEVV